MSVKKKALIVTTVASTIDQFCMNDISILLKNYDVQVAANFTTGNNTSKERINEFKSELIEKDISISDIEFDRSPLSKNNFIAYKKLKILIKQNKFDLIHCHTPIAAMITRLAAKELRQKGSKVLYTAHGFHFYKGAPILNWLVYYPVEKFLARYTDVLITINKEDYDRAKNKFKVKRVEYIPGVGVNLEKFNTVEIDRNLKRSELDLPKDALIILSVGELNKNKNHEVVIKAITKINKYNVHYVICGQGQLDGYLKKLSKELGIENQVHLLGFRNDIPEIYKISDIFAFPSLREGLSVALMESMANGLAVVCSSIRGNTDLIEDGQGGYLHEPYDYLGLAERVNRLIKTPSKAKEMGNLNIIESRKYDIRNIKLMMTKVYENILNDRV